MARTSQSERGRYRYGVCLNDQCEKCKAKEVQELPARKEFVCSECGKPLRECPPPKKKSFTWLYALIAVILLGGGVGGYFAFSGNDSKPAAPVPVKEQPDTVVTEKPAEVTDSAVVEKEEVAVPAKPVVKEPAPVPAEPQGIRVKGGIYTGKTKNGYPHGNGSIEFTSEVVFQTSAGPLTIYKGERVTGQFNMGMLILGNLYQTGGNSVVVKQLRVK